MTHDIEKLRLRSLQYWHVDGLTEIAFGAVLFALSAYFFAQATLPQESLLYQLLNVGFVLFLIGSGLLSRRFVSTAKNRLTYPRTGYVTYPKAQRGQRWLGGILAMVIGALVAGLITTAPTSLAWMPAISGLILAAVLCFFGFRFSLLRFYLLSLIVLAAGMGLALAGIGDLWGTAIFYALAGLSLLSSGGVTLRAYLRLNPPFLENQP